MTSNSLKGEEPNAGLVLGIMGKVIKKTEFFRGYASLIAALWDAPNTLTTLFETNILAIDQNEYIFLQNGFIINLNSIGALSLDVSALADISMWNQYANTVLETRLEHIQKQTHTLKIVFLIYFNLNLALH